MKGFKKVLLVAILFAINIMDAKSITRGSSVQTTTQQTVVQKPQPQPVFQPQQLTLQTIKSVMPVGSYAQALDVIRTKMRSDQVWRNHNFTPEFINFVRNSAASDIFAKALLQAGANLHIKFTGDDMIDRTILVDMNNAIDHQMELLFPKSMSNPGKPVEQPRAVQSLMHVISTNAQNLRNFDLCPLFGKDGGRYSFFNTKALTSAGKTVERFEYEEVNQNVPCIIQLSENRILMQCKTLDQFELADKTGFSAAMCGGLSLNNGRLIRNYALTGNTQSLYNMHDIPDAAQFLRKLKIGDWINAEVLRDNLARVNQELGVDGINVSVVSTVSLFDSQLNKKPGFAAFDKEEFDYVQRVKTVIRQGLKQDNYMHIMIIGNAELVESLGHYFCFAIIKKGSEVQYVVLDTIASAYHLQAGSHERNRLMFVIENIEQGSSDIKVVNLNVRFLMS